ncbi:MAG TPA: threonylcarbamoyl-AMP synthase [Nitrospirales bacterium]|nr:threonylcarbamoyl-AMP synthase [Nitrospirales bacterium]
MLDTTRIGEAADILRNGGVVAFPTETVYGIGARAYDEQAIRRIFAIKARPHNNPLIVHVASIEQVDSLVADIAESAKNLMATFWPGALTIVLPGSARVPQVITGGLTTVAVRMPDHPVASTLIRLLGEPIAAPSANRSGRPSPTHVEHVHRDVGNDVDMVLDGGTCRIGLESTVIDMSLDIPCILRSGAITIDMIQAAIGQVTLHSPSNSTTEPKSPGMQQRHYAPNFRIIPVPRDAWAQTLDEWRNSDKPIGILCHRTAVQDESVTFYRHIPGTDEEYGKGLFAAFLDAETANIDVLLVETVKEQGVGIAIMDRIRRAQAIEKDNLNES